MLSIRNWTGRFVVRACLPLSAIFCALLIVVSGSAGSSELEGPAPIRLVTGPHYPPFSADYLPHNGLAPFLFIKIFESSGKTATAELLPWKRAYREALAGNYDGVLPYVESQARKEDYLFSEPVIDLDAFIYVKSDSSISGQSIESLNDLTYCNPIGFTDGKVLEQLRTEGRVSRISPANLTNCFRMLIVGRVDFVKINSQVANYMLAHLDIPTDSIRHLPFVVEQVSLHLMVPESRSGARQLINEFNELLGRLQKNGEVESLRQRYLEQLDPGQHSD